jgi:hypothetical protein
MDLQQSGAQMFQTELAPEAGFVGWLIQQIAAPVPFVLWAVLVSPLEAAIAPWLRVSRDAFDLLLYLPIGWALSVLLAIVVQRTFPGSVASGRRIWVLPVVLLALMFVLELRTRSVAYTFAEFFYPGPGGEAWWVFFMATCPTGSAISYSLGMIWSSRRQASKASAARNSGPGDASGVTVSSAP